MKSNIDERDREIDQLLRDSQDLTQEKGELMNAARTLQQEIGKLSSLKRAILRSVDEEGGSLLIGADSSSLGLSGTFGSPHRSGTGTGAGTDDYSRNSLKPRGPSEDTGRSSFSRSRGGEEVSRPVLTASRGGDSRRDVRFDLTGNNTTAYSGSSSSNVSSSAGDSNEPYVEGKEFFKKARNRLSFDDFNAFLACIRKLNNQQITKEDSVRAAKEIFGSENNDLFEQFRSLVLKHVDGDF